MKRRLLVVDEAVADAEPLTFSKRLPLTRSSSCITLRAPSDTRSTIDSGAFARTLPVDSLQLDRAGRVVAHS